MSVGTPSIHRDEPILRRIPKAEGYYDPQKNPPIEAGAFTPNDEDDDGLSFYIERELSISALIENSPPGRSYVVVRLRAGDLYDLGVTLVPMQREGDFPGHVVVPEMN